jgi:hypothetical protein
LIRHVYEWLFELPTNTKRYLPLCKSAASKQACFDLGIELTKGSQDNYALLVSLLMAQHNKCTLMMMMMVMMRVVVVVLMDNQSPTCQMRIEFRIGEQKYKPTRQPGEGFLFPLTDPFHIFVQFSNLTS